MSGRGKWAAFEKNLNFFAVNIKRSTERAIFEKTFPADSTAICTVTAKARIEIWE
jgi:hypothetical protein